MPLYLPTKLDKLLQDSIAGKHDYLATPHKECLPNFIIIGAAKSATTSLVSILKKHKQIHLSSAKEPKFFGRNYERGWSWYAHFFKKGQHKLLRGEASTMYSSTSREFRYTPQLIKHHLGEIKIVYLVRHPIQRLVSHWRHYKGRHENCPEFKQLLTSKFLRDRMVGSSLYHQQLTRYMEYFQEKSIYCMTYEDLIGRPRKSLNSLLDFLEVQCVSKKMLKKGKVPKYNVAGTKGRAFITRPIWPEGLREEVIKIIRPDAEKMLKYMGKPVQTWDLTDD